MENRLEAILDSKQKEIEALLFQDQQDKNHPLATLLEEEHFHEHLFKRALKVAGVAVIAEIKRKSPSRGELAEIRDPTVLAQAYSMGGAAAVSVLTDHPFFGGTIEDLKQVVKSLSSLHPCPVLRKDFILHPYQVAQSKILGASAILLIVAAVKNNLKMLLDVSRKMGLDALVEVHNEDELQIAIDAGAEIIGVNNRNLKTFEVNLSVAIELAKAIPSNIIKIAESGIKSIQDVKQVHDSGYDGVLVGEMLVQSPDPEKLIAQIGNACL